MDDYKLVKFTSNRSLKEAEEIYSQRLEDAKYIYDKYKKTFFIRNCPFCGSDDYSDQQSFHDTYGVSKCNKCNNSLFVNPCPSLEALEDYYANSKSNVLLDTLYKKRHEKKINYIIDDRVNEVIEFMRYGTEKNIKVLEIGCGSGSFLSKLNHFVKIELGDKSIELHGIDVDKNAIENNVDKELNLKCFNAEEYVKNHIDKYDIIVHFELIEHLTDPSTFMNNVNSLLKPGGLTIFTTQNSNGLEMIGSDYNSFRLIAHSIFPPMHLNAFNTFNITHFGIRCNFKVSKVITPGKLDVDMLTITKDYINDQGLKKITELNDESKGLIQHLLTLVKASSHMMCVFKK